jgi:ketosteroid isomerase-like protein
MRDTEIAALEAELRQAQLAADVPALDRLIDEDLLFTGPTGQLASKADDLAAHRTGTVRITSHEPEDMRVRWITDDVAAVALRTRLGGEVAGEPFAGTWRYTRIWARSNGRWRVVAGHVSQVPSAGDRDA